MSFSLILSCVINLFYLKDALSKVEEINQLQELSKISSNKNVHLYLQSLFSYFLELVDNFVLKPPN
jgi:hypothetical protein